MTPKKFLSLTDQDQALLLAIYAHQLTIAARDTYEVGTNQLRDAALLRRINEIQHKVLSAIINRLKNNPERYPNDVLLSIITDAITPELRWAFDRAWKLYEMPRQ